MIENILASEFTVLTRLLARIAAGHYATRDYASERLRAAFELFILHFPIYRTYLTPSGPSREDREIIETALARARDDWFGADIGIFDFLRDALTLDLVARGRTGYSIARVRRFALKVQQFTGPMMAKSLEDTAFYRYHRLLALNEVGGDPAADALSIADFHERMKARAASAPRGLTATSTHDTKRGEDARARLLALTELADEWGQNVRQWRELNTDLIRSTGASRIPSAAHEYMLYQALLGAWPLAGVDASFVERMAAYAIKAAREGKQQTSWLAPNETYEAGLKQFLLRLLDPRYSRTFIDAFDAFAHRAALMGALKSLTQIALKMTMPGVPDLYHGSELWDLTLVDPDNRRPIDFAARASMLSLLSVRHWHTLAATWPDGRIKLALIRQHLALRQHLPEVFMKGLYHPLKIVGPNSDEIIAFARVGRRNAVIVACGRLFGRSTDNGRIWPSGAAWNSSLVVDGFCNINNALADSKKVTGRTLPLSELFDEIPVALLQAERAPGTSPTNSLSRSDLFQKGRPGS